MSSSKLAIHGGPPAFPEIIHVGFPSVGKRERIFERFGAIFDAHWLTNAGPQVKELEATLAQRLGVKHVICMTNATIALEIMIRAAGLSGEVIVPSFTFIATAHSLRWQEITPVFCDIDPATHNIDPAQVEALITPRTTGIIGVHLWGRPCDVEALGAIADRRGLRLMFDAAHAFDCAHKGRKIGGFGDAEVFSFHATKYFNTCEGGAVATNNDDLAAKIRLMKNFGFIGYDNVGYVGTNGKMNELCAAVGLAGLESLESFKARNLRNYLGYRDALAGVPGISLIDYGDVESANYQYIVLEVDEAECGMPRDRMLQILHAENVLARRYFYPGCHRMLPYREEMPDLHLPRTEALANRVICVPTGERIGAAEIQTITDIIKLAIESQPATARKGT